MDTESWLLAISLAACACLVVTIVALCVRLAVHCRRSSGDLEKQRLTESEAGCGHHSYDGPGACLHLSDTTTFKKYEGVDDPMAFVETAPRRTHTPHDTESESNSDYEHGRGMKRCLSCESSNSSEQEKEGNLTRQSSQTTSIPRIDFDLEFDAESSELVVSVIGARDLPGTPAGSKVDKDASQRKKAFSKRRASASSGVIVDSGSFQNARKRRQSLGTNRIQELEKTTIAPDSYVVVSLDATDAVCTELQVSDYHPIFKERFVFKISDAQLFKKTIVLKVFSREKNDRLLGISQLKLSDIEIRRQLRLSLNLINNVKLFARKEPGELMFSLSYLPTSQRLTVVVVKARLATVKPHPAAVLTTPKREAVVGARGGRRYVSTITEQTDCDHANEVKQAAAYEADAETGSDNGAESSCLREKSPASATTTAGEISTSLSVSPSSDTDSSGTSLIIGGSRGGVVAKSSPGTSTNLTDTPAGRRGATGEDADFSSDAVGGGCRRGAEEERKLRAEDDEEVEQQSSPKRRTSIVDAISGWIMAGKNKEGNSEQRSLDSDKETNGEDDINGKSEYHVKVTLSNRKSTGSCGLTPSGSGCTDVSVTSALTTTSTSSSSASTSTSATKPCKRKTKKSRGQTPIFNETMSFNVNRDDLENVFLRFKIIETKKDGEQNIIGECEVGADNGPTTGLAHWSQMLATLRHPVAMWHSLRTP